jgi:hypothetical protein
MSLALTEQADAACQAHSLYAASVPTAYQLSVSCHHLCGLAAALARRRGRRPAKTFQQDHLKSSAAEQETCTQSRATVSTDISCSNRHPHLQYHARPSLHRQKHTPTQELVRSQHKLKATTQGCDAGECWAQAGVCAIAL